MSSAGYFGHEKEFAIDDRLRHREFRIKQSVRRSLASYLEKHFFSKTRMVCAIAPNVNFSAMALSVLAYSTGKARGIVRFPTLDGGRIRAGRLAREV